MFEFIESYFIKVVKDTVDANDDGKLTAEDVLILGAQAGLKLLPRIEKTLRDYLKEQEVEEEIQYPI